MQWQEAPAAKNYGSLFKTINQSIIQSKEPSALA
jgi:hypothetical protein